MALTREQLRSKILSQDDLLQNTWFLWKRMTLEQRNLVLAGRQTISRDVPNTNNYLDDCNAVLSTIQGSMRDEDLTPSFANVLQILWLAGQVLWAWILGLTGKKS